MHGYVGRSIEDILHLNKKGNHRIKNINLDDDWDTMIIGHLRELSLALGTDLLKKD